MFEAYWVIGFLLAGFIGGIWLGSYVERIRWVKNVGQPMGIYHKGKFYKVKVEK